MSDSESDVDADADIAVAAEESPLLDVASLSINTTAAEWNPDVSRLRARKAIGMWLLVSTLSQIIVYYVYMVSNREYHRADGICDPDHFPLVNQSNQTTYHSKTAMIRNINSAAFLLPLLGGLLSDGYLGKYKTVCIGFTFYLLSTIGYTMLTMVPALCSDGLHIASLICMVLGYGLVKCNVICALASHHKKADVSIATVFLLYYISKGIGSMTIQSIMLTTILSWTALGVAVCILTIILFHRELLIGRREVQRDMLQFLQAMVFAPCGLYKQPMVSLNRRRGSTTSEGQNPVDNKNDAQTIWMLSPLFGTFIIQAFFTRMATYCFTTEILIFQKNFDYSYEHFQTIYILLIFYGSLSLSLTFLLFLKQIFNRCFENSVRSFYPFFRTNFGMLLLLFSLIVAYVVKLVKCPDGENVKELDNGLNLMLPQVVLSGISEGLVFSAGFQMAYSKAPFKLEAFTVGLFETVWGIGVAAQTGLIHFLHNFPNSECPFVPHTPIETPDGDDSNKKANQMGLLFAFSAITVSLNILLHFTCGAIMKQRTPNRREEIRQFEYESFD